MRRSANTVVILCSRRFRVTCHASASNCHATTLKLTLLTLNLLLTVVTEGEESPYIVPNHKKKNRVNDLYYSFLNFLKSKNTPTSTRGQNKPTGPIWLKWLSAKTKIINLFYICKIILYRVIIFSVALNNTVIWKLLPGFRYSVFSQSLVEIAQIFYEVCKLIL